MAGIAIITYNNYSDPKVVSKRKTQIESATCDFYNNFELGAGDVILNSQTSQNCNYAYIAAFKRYYFASPEVLHDGRLILHLKSDPLSSFWGDIKKSPCVANRSASNYDPYLQDDFVSIKEKTNYSVRRLSGQFAPSQDGANHYVLTIGGLNP